jgi:hypothetical protein
MFPRLPPKTVLSPVKGTMAMSGCEEIAETRAESIDTHRVEDTVIVAVWPRKQRTKQETVAGEVEPVAPAPH